MAHDAGKKRCPEAPSAIRRLDPRVKLVAALAYMVSCLAVQGPATLALAAGALAAGALCACVPARSLLRPLRALAVFLVVTSLINLFCIRTGPVALSLGPLTIHRDGLEAAVLYTARFFLMLVAGSLLMRTTAPLELTDALRSLMGPLERWGVDAGQAAMTLSIALRFVPILALEARTIVAAQAARGTRWETMGPALRERPAPCRAPGLRDGGARLRRRRAADASAPAAAERATRRTVLPAGSPLPYHPDRPARRLLSKPTKPARSLLSKPTKPARSKMPRPRRRGRGESQLFRRRRAADPLGR